MKPTTNIRYIMAMWIAALLLHMALFVTAQSEFMTTIIVLAVVLLAIIAGVLWWNTED